jgi:hypothetical protein
MGVKRDVAVGAERLHDGRAEREVGYEVAIHDVEVEEVGPRRLDIRHLVGEAREISRE